MENQEKTNKKDLIIKIILIIIIIILLLTNCSMMKDKYRIGSPTGNVDIFEIQCEKDSCKNSSLLIVSDNTATWKKESNLRIFTNPMYEKKDKIAPGASNIYQFVIQNGTKYGVEYSIKFIETNENKINMKYRLKKEDKYIAGNEDTWVSIEEINLMKYKLAKSENSTYYLEWKWISGENDTKYANIEDAYKLDIEIKAESEYE